MKIVYVTGLGRSGTTLLNLLLNAHSRMTGVGEVQKLYRFAHVMRKQNPQSVDNIGNKCACGAPTIWDCPFWPQVDVELQRRTGRGLKHLDLAAKDRTTFERDNLDLFAAVAAVSDAEYVIDSAKRVGRLRRLLDHPDLEVVPIHVIRNPKGQASSVRRRKGLVFSPAVEYSYRSLRLFYLLYNQPHIVVRYERLAAAPESEMQRIMDYLGLPYEPSQVHDWASREHHNLAGNVVRRATSSDIDLREAWRKELGWTAKVGIDLLAAPGRAFNRIKERRWNGAGKS